MIEHYSRLSDFSNLLVPGAVAISDENIRYAKGAFKEAIKQKAVLVQRWVIKRQKRFIYATVVVFLFFAAYQIKPYIVLQKPFDMTDIQTTLKIIKAQKINSEWVGTVERTPWVALTTVQRLDKANNLFRLLKIKGIKSFKLVDEKNNPLVVTMQSGNTAIVSLVRIPEDNTEIKPGTARLK